MSPGRRSDAVAAPAPDHPEDRAGDREAHQRQQQRVEAAQRVLGEHERESEEHRHAHQRGVRAARHHRSGRRRTRGAVCAHEAITPRAYSTRRRNGVRDRLPLATPPRLCSPRARHDAVAQRCPERPRRRRRSSFGPGSAVDGRWSGGRAAPQDDRPETDRGAERRVAEQHDPQQPRGFTAAHCERAEAP